MKNSTCEYEAAILVNNRPIPEVNHNGRTYIEGRKNSQYSLKITNHTGNRILAIMSVDGINVIDGELCGINSSGYVVGPYSNVIVPGFKVKNSNLAGSFTFKPQEATSRRDKTYTEQMGVSRENQGVIGFMIFREKMLPQYTLPSWNTPRSHSRDPGKLYSCNSVNSVFDTMSLDSSTISSTVSSTCDSLPVDKDEGKSLGTGFGEAVEFNTVDVKFDRENPTKPDATFVFQYDTLRNLEKIGVPVERFRRHGGRNKPGVNPFPASPDIATKGCTPPPGWKC